jgi:hypothetical protein
MFDTTGNSVYRSVNYGRTWTLAIPYANLLWTSVSCDQSGTYVIATTALNNGVIYRSEDGGQGWFTVPATLSLQIDVEAWVDSAVSSNADYMYIVSSGLNNGLILQSTSQGVSWNQLINAPKLNYKSIACDSTGQYVTATVFSGQIYSSSDYGVTWTAQNVAFKMYNDFGTYTTWTFDNVDLNIPSLSAGAIAGIVLGVLAFVCCVAALIGVFCCGLCKACQKQDRLLKAPGIEFSDKA